MNDKRYDFFYKEIEELKSKDLYRTLVSVNMNCGRNIALDGKEYVNFASNNYLDLANDKRIIEAGCKTAYEYGAGSGASRLISGSIEPVFKLENEFARFSGKESSLLFNSGYNANVGVISALSDKNTVIFSDKLNHASIYDGIFLSGAAMERFPHKNIEILKKLLLKHSDKKKKIIITDTVFSMEGSIAPLRKIVDLAKNDNALIIADEAHSVGIFGKNYSGIVSKLGLNKEVDIIIGTLGKGFGVFGSYVACDDILKEYLINKSRPFIFTTALPPFVIGSLTESLKIVENEGRGKTLLEKAFYLKNKLKNEGYDTGESESQIIPVITGANKTALELMTFLKDRGFFVPAVRPPTVPPNKARIRISLSYSHNYQDIDNLFEAIRDFFEKGNS